MAQVVFIENWGETVFWGHVAQRLQTMGHTIGEIVQNTVYTPLQATGEQIVMPFPAPADLTDGPVPQAVSTDRGRNYFGAGARHYTYYVAQIETALDKLQPDVVIGEPTLFHELLSVAACRARNIPYLHPTMTRYPGGSFNILDGDSQIPATTSEALWPEAITWAKHKLCVPALSPYLERSV